MVRAVWTIIQENRNNTSNMPLHAFHSIPFLHNPSLHPERALQHLHSPPSSKL